MGMDKYGCFMQYMFIISETIVNIEHAHGFMGHRCFSKNLFMFIRHMKKKNTYKFQFPITSLSLH